MPSPQTEPFRLTQRNSRPSRLRPHVNRGLYPVRYRDGPNVRGLAHQVGDYPMLLPLLDVVGSQFGYLTPA